MGLNSDKTSKVFCLNNCSFSTRFYFFCNIVVENRPNFIKIVDAFDLYTACFMVICVCVLWALSPEIKF